MESISTSRDTVLSSSCGGTGNSIVTVVSLSIVVVSSVVSVVSVSVVVSVAVGVVAVGFSGSTMNDFDEYLSFVS